MKFGAAISEFGYPGGARSIATHVATTAEAIEDAGFHRLVVVDHLWQFGAGGVDEEMLEAYTTLRFLAAATAEIELLTLVTCPLYRPPGVLAKIVTTLDVLSEGRAWLGIGSGAPFSGPEASGLGLPFPPVGEQIDRLEETLQICLQMWSGDQSPFVGRHYQLGRTLNSPQSIRPPHPPILVAGSGVKRTLRLVSTYADACNLFMTRTCLGVSTRSARTAKRSGARPRRSRSRSSCRWTGSGRSEHRRAPRADRTARSTRHRRSLRSCGPRPRAHPAQASRRPRDPCLPLAS